MNQLNAADIDWVVEFGFQLATWKMKCRNTPGTDNLYSNSVETPWNYRLSHKPGLDDQQQQQQHTCVKYYCFISINSFVSPQGFGRLQYG